MKTTNDMEKNTSAIELYKATIAQVYTEESEKSLQELKNAIKAQSIEYQQAKQKLLRIEAEICGPLINKTTSAYIAQAFYKAWGYDNAETLQRLIVNENGVILRNGQPVVLQTIQQMASYADYLKKSLIRRARVIRDVYSECVYLLASWLKQGLPVDAVKDTAFTKFGITNERNKQMIIEQAVKLATQATEEQATEEQATEETKN